MAEGGSANGDSEEWSRTKDARNIRELFHGRLTDNEAARLLRTFEWDMGRTVNHILDAGPGELSQLLNTNGLENRIDFVTRDNVLRDLARNNEIGNSIRQFACQDCDKMWWHRVPNRKMVSRCNRCRRKYDALSRDDEWGWAEYECECGNTFTGTGHMGRSQSMCYQCRTMCYPAKILPPMKRDDPRRRTGNTHSCSGENCFNRRGMGNHGQMCLHPRSLQGRVVQSPSQPHVSSGSTVNTFLDQDDIDQPAYEPSLSGIPEVSD